MSTINRMLRDLDARGAQPARAASVVPIGGVRPAPRPAGVGRAARILMLGIVAAGLAGAAGYALLQRQAPTSAPAPLLAAVPAVPTPLRNSIRPEAAPEVLPSMRSQSALTASPTQPSAILARVDPPPATGKTSAEALPPGKSLAAETLPSVAATATLSLKPSDVPPVPTPVAPAEIANTQVSKVAVGQTPQEIARQLQSEGDLLRRAGKHKPAILKFQEALERMPTLVGARTSMAQILFDQGETGTAVDLLKTGYALESSPEIAAALGRMLSSQEVARAEAIVWLTRGADALRPADRALWAALLAEAHRHDEAVREYQRALTDESHNGGWLLGLGLSFEALGRHQEAQTAYRRALAWGNFKPEVVDFLKARTKPVSP